MGVGEPFLSWMDALLAIKETSTGLRVLSATQPSGAAALLNCLQPRTGSSLQLRLPDTLLPNKGGWTLGWANHDCPPRPALC